MRKSAFGLIAVSILVFGTGALALPSHMEYDVAGTTNFMVHPVVWAGTVTAGEPLLLGGYWTLEINDTGWPPQTNKAARWAYIDATYYTPNYSPYTYSWTATFDENTTAGPVLWDSGRSGVGDMTGTATLQTTISEFDFDGVIDPDERAFMVFSGTLIVVKNGTGVFAGYCGLGSFSGWTTNSDPYNWADDDFTLSTILDVEDCSVPVREVNWGFVKNMYND